MDTVSREPDGVKNKGIPDEWRETALSIYRVGKSDAMTEVERIVAVDVAYKLYALHLKAIEAGEILGRPESFYVELDRRLREVGSVGRALETAIEAGAETGDDTRKDSEHLAGVNSHAHGADRTPTNDLLTPSPAGSGCLDAAKVPDGFVLAVPGIISGHKSLDLLSVLLWRLTCEFANPRILSAEKRAEKIIEEKDAAVKDAEKAWGGENEIRDDSERRLRVLREDRDEAVKRAEESERMANEWKRLGRDSHERTIRKNP